MAPPLVVSENVNRGMLLSFPTDVDKVGEEESKEEEDAEVREEESSNLDGVDGTEPDDSENPLL